MYRGASSSHCVGEGVDENAAHVSGGEREKGVAGDVLETEEMALLAILLIVPVNAITPFFKLYTRKHITDASGQRVHRPIFEEYQRLGLEAFPGWPKFS